MTPDLDNETSSCFDVHMTTTKETAMPNYSNSNLDGAAEALMEILTDHDYTIDRTCDLASNVATIASSAPADPESDDWYELQTDAENATWERMARQMLTRWGQWEPARTSKWDGRLVTATFEETLPDSGRRVSVTVHVDALKETVNWSSLGGCSTQDALFYADLIQAAALWISRQVEQAETKAEEV